MTEESTGSDTTSFLSAVTTEQSNSTQIIKQENNHQWITNKQTNVQTDNTKRRAGGPGGLEGRVAKWKTWIIHGLASCTEERAGSLHYRTGRWVAH